MKKIVLLAFAVWLVAGCHMAENRAVYQSACYRLGSELNTENVRPGLCRQVLCYNDDIMLVKVIFGEEMVGQRPDMHSHPHSQSSYVVCGRFEFHCGDTVMVLGPGDSFLAAPDVPHEAYCLEPGIIIDGFSPIRESFIK